MTVKGHVVPHESQIYSLGHDQLRWDGWFNDVHITGQLHANDVNYNTLTNASMTANFTSRNERILHPDDPGFHNDTLVVI